MKPFSFSKFLVAGVVLLGSAAGASAQTISPCYGGSVLFASQGLQTNGQPVAADRSDEFQVIGAPTNNSAGNFYSLGVNGYIDISFDGVVFDLPGNDIKVYETSFSGNDCGKSDDESADISLSQDGITWIPYGTICRDEEIDIALTGLAYVTAIRIANSASTPTLDGYDVDAVEALNGCEDFSVLEPEGCYAESLLSYTQGTGTIAANRLNPLQALGEPERDNTVNFVSLGFGGELVIGFDQAAIALPGVDDLEVVETTFNNRTCGNYEERADVYVSQQIVSDPTLVDHSQFVKVGQSCTNGAFFDVHAATGWSYFTLVKFKDVSPVFGNRDGYDVDGIVALHGCQPYPELVPGECYAAQMVDYTQGTEDDGSPLLNNRIDPNKALGEPERTDALVFVTLGYDGSIILGFNGSVPNLPGDDLEIVETSFGNMGCAQYREYADVYVSQDGATFHFAKTVCKSEPFVDISDAGPFSYINYVKIVNNNMLSKTFDAFDLDGVVALHNCAPTQLSEVGQFRNNYDERMSAIELNAFPNPTVGPLNVEFTTPEEQLVTVELIDMSGRVINTLFRQVANAGQNYRLEMDGASLPNGVYITKLSTNHEIVIKKVLVAR